MTRNTVSKPKVLIYAPREEPKEILSQFEQAGYELVFGDIAWQKPRGQHEDAFVAKARDAIALMGTSVRATPISRRIMESSQRLRIVCKYTVGFDDIDVKAATDLGILVCNSPTEANCFAVAESTVALMLALQKKLFQRDADVREGKWREPDVLSRFVGSRVGDDYPGLTLGIVGFGRIGSRVAYLLAPWRMRILACDPYVDPVKFALHGVTSVDYETLLKESDIISFHCNLTEETHNMLSDRQLALVKPTAIIVNTSRGKVVDEDALGRAIKAGRLEAAAVDAWREEPPAADSLLRQLGDKVLMTPHSAGVNVGGELRFGIHWATRSVLAALAGQIPHHVVNPEVIPSWKKRFGGVPVIE